MTHPTTLNRLTPRLVLLAAAIPFLPAVSAEEKVCTTRFGVTTCRTLTAFYIKLAIVGGVFVLLLIGLLVYFLVRHRQKRELDAIVSDMEPSQIRGAQPTTYHRSPPPPPLNLMVQIPSPDRDGATKIPYSASPYGMPRNGNDRGVALGNGHGVLPVPGTDHMLFAGPTGTPHYPHSAVPSSTHQGHEQSQPQQTTHMTRRRSTDDERMVSSTHGAYPFVGYSSENPPPGPAPANVPPVSSNPDLKI